MTDRLAGKKNSSLTVVFPSIVLNNSSQHYRFSLNTTQRVKKHAPRWTTSLFSPKVSFQFGFHSTDDRYWSAKCFLVVLSDDELLVHKWLAIQAGVSAESTMETMDVLKAHPLFDIRNPNAVRALFGRFTLNTPQFHRNDGRGYRFIAQAVLDVDPINGSVAARLATALTTWAQYVILQVVVLSFTCCYSFALASRCSIL